MYGSCRATQRLGILPEFLLPFCPTSYTEKGLEYYVSDVGEEFHCISVCVCICQVEEEQRADARLRQEQGIEWQPKVRIHY